jgi:hypothetical protein
MKINNMKSKIIKFLSVGAVLGVMLLPQMSLADPNLDPNFFENATGPVFSGASGGTAAGSNSCDIPRDISGLFTVALCILDGAVIPFLVGLALVLFIAGVVRFVSAGDNEEKRQGGREMMLFGIISLFVMLSVWGFVNILSNTFFGKNSRIVGAPEKSNQVFVQF